MKLSTTATAAFLLSAASAITAVSADLSHSPYVGHLQRRDEVSAGNAQPILAARQPLVPSLTEGNAKMVKRSKRSGEGEPLFGAMPIMGAGTAPIVGLVQRDNDAPKHNGKQGYNQASSSSSAAAPVFTPKSSASSDKSTSDSSNEEDDDDDEEDCDDDEDDSDDTEDCDEDSSTATSSSSGTSSSSAPAVSVSVKAAAVQFNANVNTNANTAAKSSSSAPKMTSSAASSAQPASTGSSSGTKYSGIATFYTQNNNAGACGKVNPDSAYIIALPTAKWDNGKNCGKTVQIYNTQDGTSVTATVADLCPSCETDSSIDLSVGAMSALDKQYQTHGIRQIQWWYTS
ncbi:hypothetical protein EMMF5_002965 [Cystobasidiomycetes sp. EMM_F5]